MANRSMDCNVELATRLIMSELDIDTDFVQQKYCGYTFLSGRKFFRLPNWMKEGELILLYGVPGVVVKTEVLGVIRNGSARFRDNTSIKGNIMVQISVLQSGKIEHYYGTVSTWRKIGNASQKFNDASGCFTVRKLMFTWNNYNAHPGLDGFQVQVVNPLAFRVEEFKDDVGGWWKFKI